MEVKYPVSSFFIHNNFVKKCVIMKKEQAYFIERIVNKNFSLLDCNTLIINMFELLLGVKLLPFFFEFKQVKFEL